VPSPQPEEENSLPGVDLESLARFLDDSVEGGVDTDSLRVSLLAGGRSNLTYTVTDGGREWVLRRPPLGHVLETAHDMSREYRVMDALSSTPVPVPGMVGFCSDTSLMGTPFYVMDKVPGIAYRDAKDFETLTKAGRNALGEAFIDALGELACVDYDRVGLSEFGRPEGFAGRQVRRWTKQLENSTSREVEGIQSLGEALAARVPPMQRAAIVHGDFRLDNALVDSQDPGHVHAVIDWEMSTLGDPLSDLGMLYLFWEGWQGLDNPIAATPADFPGFPSWTEMRDRYVDITHLDLDHFQWHAAFAFYKLAVICEGIHFRYVNQLTVGDGFEGIGAMVTPLVSRGLSTLHP
jgi:aminoglycoside phosphotransferase (APT) family kinase protein